MSLPIVEGAVSQFPNDIVGPGGGNKTLILLQPWLGKENQVAGIDRLDHPYEDGDSGTVLQTGITGPWGHDAVFGDYQGTLRYGPMTQVDSFNNLIAGEEGGLSVEFWFKGLVPTAAATYMPFHFWSTGNNQGAQIGYYPFTYLPAIYCAAASSTKWNLLVCTGVPTATFRNYYPAEQNTLLADGQWHHIAFAVSPHPTIVSQLHIGIWQDGVRQNFNSMSSANFSNMVDQSFPVYFCAFRHSAGSDGNVRFGELRVSRNRYDCTQATIPVPTGPFVVD